MNEMLKLLDLIFDLIKNLVWPMLIVWIILIFRKEIKEKIPDLSSSRMKFGGVEFEIKSLKAELSKTNSVVSKLGENSSNPIISNAAKSLPKPNEDQVIEWAKNNGADNPWNMGRKNWERCLYDLNYPGGKYHKLEKCGDGKLKYQ